MILQISRSQISNEKDRGIYFSKKMVYISLKLNKCMFLLAMEEISLFMLFWPANGGPCSPIPVRDFIQQKTVINRKTSL